MQVTAMDPGSGTVRLAPAHGQHSVRGFLTERRLNLLAAKITELTGKRLKLQLDAPATGAGPAQSQGGSDASGLNGAPGRDDRRAALDTPLARQLLEAFPDATLTHTRRDDNDSG